MALAAVSPLMLKVFLSLSTPKGAITGICFLFMTSLRNSIFIVSGIPTNPSSLLSGMTLIILFNFDVIETACEPFFFRESTISLLNSINTSSTIEITFSSVILKPLINFV